MADAELDAYDEMEADTPRMTKVMPEPGQDTPPPSKAPPPPTTTQEAGKTPLEASTDALEGSKSAPQEANPIPLVLPDFSIPEVVQKPVSLPDCERFTADLGGPVKALIDMALGIKAITTPEEYARVVEIGKTLKERRDLISKEMDAITKPAYAAWKGATSLRAKLLDPVDAAIDSLRTNVTRFRLDMERRQKEEEERRIREQKEREAEARRREEERQAEMRRQQEEYEAKKRAHDEAVRQADEKRRKEEEDARLRHAEAARDQGNTERIEAILETKTPEVPLPPMPPAPEPPKPLPPPPPPPVALPQPPMLPTLPSSGVKRNTKWKARILDPRKLVELILSGDPRFGWECLEFNQGLLDKKATKDKEAMTIPGVIEAYPERKDSFA